jgi:chemotaxis protein CheX
MNVKFLNPFLEAVFEVIKTETGFIVNKGDLNLEKGAYITDDVTVIIALVGAVEGNVFYGMSTSTAIALVSRMMGEQMEKFDTLAQSGIAELGNVITGSASVKLSDAGFEATISPPTLILGKGATISTLDFPRLIVPLKAECGEIVVHLALRESITTQKTAQIPVPAKPSVL